jgi:hypothetical protein
MANFSTLIMRPTVVGPAQLPVAASGGLLEEVTTAIAPRPTVQFQQTPLEFQTTDGIDDDSPDTGPDTGTGTSGAAAASSSSSGASSSATGSSGGSQGSINAGLPGPVESIVDTVSNFATNPVDTVATAVGNQSVAGTVGNAVGSQVGKATAAGAFGPAAVTGPVGLAAGVIGGVVGQGIGAAIDVANSNFTGFTFGNIAKAAIPGFFGGMSIAAQEDESAARSTMAEEAFSLGLEMETESLFDSLVDTTENTPEKDIQQQIEDAKIEVVNEEVNALNEMGPPTAAEAEAAEAAAARGNEAELDVAPAPDEGDEGGDDSVVCSALHHHDLFDARGYFEANNYGATLYRKNPSVMRGYWKIARPVVWLVNHTPSHGKYIIRPVMRAIVKHVSGHGSPVGALIVKTLSPLCALLGRKR